MTDHTPSPIVFIDVETDGLHHGRRIWEVAMIRREPDGAETPKRMFVGIDLRNSDPKGLEVGGYWDRHPAGRKISGKEPSPVDSDVVYCKHDAAKAIMRTTFGAHLVGVNPAFDADTIAGLLRAEGYHPAWHYHLIDLIALSYGYLNGLAAAGARPPGILAPPPFRSDDLAVACGVAPPTVAERHTAMGDARWAQRWYDTIVGGTQ